MDTEIRRLTDVAREGKATPAELGSGTFILNNYDVFGVVGSAAMINYPEVATLGAGRIVDKPWVVDGESRANGDCIDTHIRSPRLRWGNLGGVPAVYS